MQMAQVVEVYGKKAVLLMALELSAAKWLVMFSDGKRRRQVSASAGDCGALLEQIAKSRQRFGLAAETPVMSCHEAGRDGHWIHRWLLSEGIDNRQIDAASIAVNRRGRQAKTDRVDVGKLMGMLERVAGGEAGVWKEVRVPSAEVEDQRRVHRERERLVKERGGHSNRISSLLITQGIKLTLSGDFEAKLDQAKTWDGRGLGPELKAELRREWQRYQLVQQQIRQLEQRQREQLKRSTDEGSVKMRQLMQLKSVGEQTAWVLGHEFYGWRQFRNRREVGALSGLTPTPYQSGTMDREQGISKAGISRVRTIGVELAWRWLRCQPQSALSQWFRARFEGGKRSRRIGIVALARKLLVALWHYLDHGVIPEGAALRG